MLVSQVVAKLSLVGLGLVHRVKVHKKVGGPRDP